MRLFHWASVAVLVATATAFGSGPRAPSLQLRKDDGLQTNITWDQYSLLINGQRQAVFSGEFHPYRLPVHDLYLDVFQKIKSAGFTAVSFYTFWGLHEPKRGAGVDFSGFRDVEPFIQAAQTAGLYLIARPGPYINAETTGGGFPGWGARDPSLWRTSNTSYTEAWQDYVSGIGKLIAKYQFTNGGPIILVQVENEYTGFASGHHEDFTYENDLKSAFRSAGIVVPFTFNDASPSGHFTSVDIWGYDSYPNGFDCSHPYTWNSGAVPTGLYASDRQYAPAGTPNANYEFQGGAFDGWGGTGYDDCAILTGTNFERVFYKNRFAQSATLLNLYMIFGGTNWGGIAHPGVYTSYDYGSAIAEDRTLREKYYELKLQAHFYIRSPAWLTSQPTNAGSDTGAFTGNSAVGVTQTRDKVGNVTTFYTIRQTDASSSNTQTFKLTVPSSKGNLTLPLLGGSLSLTGKDSKITVVDYTAGSTHLLYSTGEIATWATVNGRDIFVLYGNSGETLETAFIYNGTTPPVTVVSGSNTPKTATKNGALVLQYIATGSTVVTVGSNVLLYIVDRANAYQFWTLYPPTSGSFAHYGHANPVLVKGGYFLRNATSSGGTLALTGDLNATFTSFEILAPSASASKVTFNGQALSVTQTKYGTLVGSLTAQLPAVQLPALQNLTWKSANSLPEITSTYSDAAWPSADHTTTNNSAKPSTPVILYASDYGFHTGNILWRGHFVSTGSESSFSATVIGGAAFGFSAWLNGTFLGSWEGNSPTSQESKTFTFARLTNGKNYVITILQDHMGLEEDFTAAGDQFKTPRGITAYSFPGSTATKVTWKVTGNLGGENYVDKARGPLNEGGLYGERQGWHLPGFNDSQWSASKPTDGISSAGVQFYRTTFALSIPAGVDYPIAVAVTNSTVNPHYRAKIYVNGYQFGHYVNAIGPQTNFPIPQGVLNYQGNNTLALALWAHDAAGAKVNNLHLQLRAQAESSIGSVTNLDFSAWSARTGAY